MTPAPDPLEPSRTLTDLLVAVSASIADERDVLNRLDGVAGDGDLGVTATLAAAAIALAAPEARQLPTTGALRRIGTEIARGAPSTAGTLVAFAFLAAGRVGGAEAESVPSTGAIDYLEAAERSIAERGKVAAGDRTMLDALSPAVAAWKAAIRLGDPTPAAARAAADAANLGAVATASMTATVGRSAWLGERARGHEDAGARLVAMAFEAAARHLSRAPD